MHAQIREGEPVYEHVYKRKEDANGYSDCLLEEDLDFFTNDVFQFCSEVITGGAGPLVVIIMRLRKVN